MTPLFVARSKTETPNTTVSQSSAMMPLTWHMAILVAGTVGAAGVGAPKWLIGLLAAFTGGTVILAWTTYLRLLRSDREALRSHESHIPRIVTERAALATEQESRSRLPGGGVEQPSLPPSSATERGG
jgi:hypothetical protein